MTQAKTSEASDLHISVETPSAWNRKLTITVPASRVRPAREQVVATIAHRVRRRGFRKGHVPRQIVERDYRREIDRETLQRLVDESLREAVAQERLEPITEGAIEILRYSSESESDLVFAATFDVRPEIRLSRLGGFKIRREAVTVSDEEVTERLAELREAHAAWRPVERAPRVGDKAAVVLTPLDATERGEGGEGGEGGQARSYEFPLGKGHAIPDVENALLTLAPREEGEFTVTYPADFPDESRRNTSQRIRLRLESVSEKELPELDDAFAGEVSDGADLEELRNRIAERIRQEKEGEERSRVRNELLDRILEANPFEVPESMIQRYLDALLTPAPDAAPEAVDRFRERYRPAALRGIKRTLVIQRVAEEAGLPATHEEVAARIAEWAKRADRPAAEVRRELERSGELQQLTRRITEEKVFEHLESLNTIG